MALVSKSIPNLINGVSQQPAALRLESQGEVQENGFSDVVDGLKKRPPTKFLNKLKCLSGDSSSSQGNLHSRSDYVDLTGLDTAYFHTYKRSDDEQYHVVITNNRRVHVYDLDGNLRYQSGHSSWLGNGNWLSHNSDDTSYLPYYTSEITSTSVADATFIVNKQKTVEMSEVIDPKRTLNQALVYLKSVNYARVYTVDCKSKQGSKDLDASQTTPRQITATVSNSGDEINSEGLRVSAIVSEDTTDYPTASGAALRTQIASDLGSADIDSFSSISTVGNTATPASIVSRLTLTNVNLGGLTTTQLTDDIHVLVGGSDIPYDSTGSNGWRHLNNTTIELPSYAYQVSPMPMNIVAFSRATALVTDTSGSSTHGFITPRTPNREPYFIINTTNEGNVKDFDITVSDDDGGVNLKAFKETAKSFSDLPNQCEPEFRLGVVGDNQKKEDDFHVVFKGNAGSGYWKETVGYDLQNYFDLTTMPHTLKQSAGLSFSFGQGEWDERKAGDENTNATPSFVGQKISDIFFHRNRLGVLSGENVIFSEASGYFNFWRTTVRTLLDSDPIDVSVSQNEVSELKAAVPIQDNLLLFTELNQFTLSATQLLTPAEVTVDQSTKYECDLTASPVSAGNSVFFATQSSGYAGVREFFTRETTEVRDAASVTSHVPAYLEGNIRQFASSANEDMLACLTSGNKKECYIYKWYNSSNERLQSAWSKWIFAENIAHIFFTNNLMYLTFEDGRYEILDVKYDHTEVLLDRQYKLTSADFQTSPTQINLPDGVPTVGLVAIDQDGISLGAFDPANPTFDQNNELFTNRTLVVGVPYTFKYQMSEQVFKPKQGDSTQLARFQLRKISFNYNDTGHFDVTVDSVGRSPITSHFTGRVLDNQHNLLDQSAVIDDGAFQVGVQAQATETAITITNDSHLPSTFQSAEWEGYIVLRNQRL